jgi:hypothetical protein
MDWPRKRLRRGLKVDGYLKKLEQREREAKSPVDKALFREEIDRVRKLMSPPEQGSPPPEPAQQ